MDLASIRMITDDLERTVQFYEQVTGVAAVRYTPVFAELNMPSCTLVIGHTRTTQLFGTDSARPADNHTVIIEFRVEDVDSEYTRLKPLVNDWVQGPTTMPWGNRLHPVSRPRRQPSQPLHAGHRRSRQEVQQLTENAALSRLPAARLPGPGRPGGTRVILAHVRPDATSLDCSFTKSRAVGACIRRNRPSLGRIQQPTTGPPFVRRRA
jgi:catechol 2,3-dioxygenase-like lactoylglutathione lyase family enzyme